MNQAETQYQEILHTLDKLLANLGLMLEDYDVEYLTQADLYIEMFKVMFPVLEPVLSGGFEEDVTDEEIIQYLVNVLAKDIIKMDLDHIKGELIVQGDAKNILNFLQLLYEISKMVVDKDEKQSGKRSKRKKNQKLVKSSTQSANQSHNQSQDNSVEWKQKYNSVLGINAEFSNGSVSESASDARPSEENSYGEDYTNLLDERALLAQRLKENAMADHHQLQGKNIRTDPRLESHSVSRISEVSKSKESSEYDKRPKKYSGVSSQKIEDFNPAILHRKSLGADPKYGSYNSDDMRALRGVDEEEEEEVIEDREDPQEEGTEQEYEAEHEPGYTPEPIHEGHEEEEEGGEEEDEEISEDHANIEEQEEYLRQVNGEGDLIDENGEDYTEEEMRKISTGQAEEDDVEYYPDDPINYEPMSKGVQRRSQEPERDEERDEEIEKVDRMHEDVQNDEEEQGDEESQQRGEEESQQIGEEEADNIEEVDDYVENSEEIREREGEEETDSQQGIVYREGMHEVTEEEYDEEAQNGEESYNDSRKEVQYPQQAYTQEQLKKRKTKSKGGKKKAKSGDPSQKTKIVQRALKPETPGMKIGKQSRNNTSGKISAKKSKGSSGSKPKKLVHSKSERNLNAPDDQEEAPSQYEEEYSEDKGLEPKQYEANEEGSEAQSQKEQQSDIQEDKENMKENLQGVPDGNVFKILSDNVMRVKENLRENKEIQDIAFDDEKTIKVIMQQKNQYKQYLNDFMKDHQIRERKYMNLKELAQRNFEKKMKSEKIRDDMLKREFSNQQKSLYFKMRDEKVNFLRKTHKTIFELEKKRIIEDKKEYIDFRKSKNQETRNMIDSIKNEYKNKVSLLKERNQNEHYERKIASEAQRSFMKTIESELKMDQMREAERMKDKLRHEKERFEMMMKDEGFLTQKVMQLYKKGTF